MKTITITTNCDSSGYHTNTVQGCRGCCTASPEAAALRLAVKLYGTLLKSVKHIGPGAMLLEDKFEVTTVGDPIAWCWASGLIEIGAYLPAGAIEIAKGPYEQLQRELSVAARHAKGSTNLLVPGVPEAATQKLKGDALETWLIWCAKRRTKRITWAIADEKVKAAA